ncbi:MAG: STAS domain-containing protein [Planctomycetes bacterium]|nr:STAS domain-containing protein [Planctomycetota bacterium]MBM4078415.1 STAS domain-containing protein [Planctomycetota bacterium]
MIRRKRDGVDFVWFEGQVSLDEGEVAELHQSVQPSSPTNPVKLVVSLEGIQLVRTAAWGKLMLLHQEIVKAGGQFKLCHLETPVQDCLEVMKLHRLFDVAVTEEDARRAIQS